MEPSVDILSMLKSKLHKYGSRMNDYVMVIYVDLVCSKKSLESEAISVWRVPGNYRKRRVGATDSSRRDGEVKGSSVSRNAKCRGGLRMAVA